MCDLFSVLNFSCFRSGKACNHDVSLMYALADLTAKKVDGKLASTSKKCVWDAFNNPRQRKLSPKKASGLTQKAEARKARYTVHQFDPR